MCSKTGESVPQKRICPLRSMSRFLAVPLELLDSVFHVSAVTGIRAYFLSTNVLMAFTTCFADSV